ncbi:MAG: DUF4412 domain-containing protein [Bacteroidota bacterium]
MKAFRIFSLLSLALIAVAAFCSFGFQQAGDFEGVIEFSKKTGSTEVKYKYYVKGDKVRIEDFGTDGSLQGVMLVDMKTNKVIGLNPDRKLYMDVPNNRQRKDMAVSVEKTGNTKSIAGYTCSEWKVTCDEDDRVITYWMGEGKFNFFIPMLKTLNRADKLSTYFIKLTGAEGLFPMLGEEKKKDGTLITTLKVTSVKIQTLAATQFEIPKGYSKYDK